MDLRGGAPPAAGVIRRASQSQVQPRHDSRLALGAAHIVRCASPARLISCSTASRAR